MKKIVMLLDNDFRSDNRVEKEAQTLIKEGYSVKVICLTHPDLPVHDEKNGVIIHRLIDPSLYTRPFSKAAQNGSKAIVDYLTKEVFDILHCHDYNMVHIGCMLKQTKSEITMVYDAHEFFSEFSIHRNVIGAFNKIKAFVVWRLLLLREKKSAAKYDALVSTTAYIVDKLSKKFNIKKHNFLRNIPEKQTVVSSNYLKTAYGFSPNSFVVVHTGNIYFQPEHLLSLYAGLKNSGQASYLVFFIDNARSLRFRNFIETHQLSDLIFFHDYPKKSDMLNQLSSADIGFSWVNPAFKSQVYTSANRFWEYTLSGIPIISNYQWEIDTEIRKSQQGIVYTNEQDGFGQSLQQMLLNIDTYKANAKLVSDNNCWETEVQKLVSLYKTLD